MDSNNKGSEWRKWDLHIHTKYSMESRAKLSVKEVFQEAIINEISVISITEHNNVDSLDEIWDVWDNGEVDIDGKSKKISDLINFLPGIELRTDKGKHSVHLIAIFPKQIGNKKVNRELLKEDFLSKINASTSDIEKSGDGDYASGLFKHDVDFEEAAKRVRELGGLTIVHSGTKSNGIEKEMAHEKGKEPTSQELLNSLGTRKSELMNSFIDICEVPDNDKKNLAEAKFYFDQFSKPTITGSDSHEDYKGNKFTWIKADPTFEGLKQIIYEPEDRVYLGEEPEILKRVNDNKTKYISKLCIDSKPGKTAKFGEWFKKVEIPLNYELVTIIGNKGSGKSALSDIIGLLTNTRAAGNDQRNLTFLNNYRGEKRFRKIGFAENFEARLIWASDDEVVKSLDDDIDLTDQQVEKARYLPQNYFEKLTNEIDGKDFTNTLNEVIYKHIPDSEKLSTNSFEELEQLKSEVVEEEIQHLYSEIKKTNQEIIKLDNQNSDSYKKKLINLIAEKEKELLEHKKTKPEEVPDPSKELSEEKKKEKDKQLADLQKCNEDIEKLESAIAKARSLLVIHNKKREKLSQFKKKLENFKDQIDKFIAENEELITISGFTLSEFSLPIDTSEVQSKLSDIDTIIATIEAQLSNTEILDETMEIDSDANENASSLVIKLREQLTQRNKLKDRLSKPDKKYQEYKEKILKWENRKKAIEGNESTKDSLVFYQKQLEFVENQLNNDIEELKEKRLDQVVKIFDKKSEILSLYSQFKKAIDQEIGKDADFLEKFNMTIDANFVLDEHFSSKVLSYINLTQKGTYRGKEDGEKAIFKVLEGKNLQNSLDVREILKELIDGLEFDKRDGEDLQKRDVVRQVEDLSTFYDYLFSLDYLIPTYELKLDGKKLQELSPGEKGALLLVFYLLIDTEDIPLVIDQPEDNLDNKSVYEVLTHFIKFAKRRRQIILVTHNPNLAIGADAEQIIYVNLDKKDNYKFSFMSGGIENPAINAKTVEILEGTMPAFDKRKLKYFEE